MKRADSEKNAALRVRAAKLLKAGIELVVLDALADFAGIVGGWKGNPSSVAVQAVLETAALLLFGLSGVFFLRSRRGQS